MRFEKVSFASFYKDMKKHFWKITDEEINAAYDRIVIPQRKTRYAACYDISSPIKITVTPGQSATIPSGLKFYASPQEREEWCAESFIRSSFGIKCDLFLKTGVSIIDADYYNSPENEGDILIPVYNFGFRNCEIGAGERVAQIKLSIYGKTENDLPGGERSGGVGSTGK